MRHPERTVAFVAYGQRLSRDHARKALAFARMAGLELRYASADRWVTPEMGGVIWTSIEGSFTGQGAHVLVVDDPHKNRQEAESELERERVWEWFNGVARDRLEPDAPIVVMHTRWHPDDLMGRLLEQQGTVEDGGLWTHVNLRAVETRPDGTEVALWPERWPIDNASFREQREFNQYEWYSKYQGEPRPRGGSLFAGTYLYEELPRSGYRVSIGVDLAVSKKTYADWNAAVVLVEKNEEYFVADVRRAQADVRTFKEVLREVLADWPGAETLWYTGGQEASVASLLDLLGVPVQTLPAGADKYARAQPASVAWKSGRILVPRTKRALLRRGPQRMLDERLDEAPEWVAPFTSEVLGFTGVNDQHDDQVDALAAAYDVLQGPPEPTYRPGVTRGPTGDDRPVYDA